MRSHCLRILQKQVLRLVIAGIVLSGFGTGTLITGCKKARLFTHLDSIPAQPSQLHIFNNFGYNDSMALSIDGLRRENMKQYGFSSYYPSSSAFNQNSEQPNSKQIKIFDALNSTQFANAINNSIFQFLPNTSYIGIVSYNTYDTNYSPKKNTIPTLRFYPEDLYHPFSGTTGVRMLNATAVYQGYYNISLTLSPNKGQGTSLALSAANLSNQPASYSTTQQGLKKCVLNIAFDYNLTAQLIFFPVELQDAKNYTFIPVGDMVNYKNGKEPLPRLFVVEDGVPSSLRELTLSNLNYINNVGSTKVTVVNGVYNIPVPGEANNNIGFDVRFNDVKTNVIRWPGKLTGTGEDVGLSTYFTITDSTSAVKAAMGRVSTVNLSNSGPVSVTVTPAKAFSPLYRNFNYNFESNLSYTLCLLPDNGTSNTMNHIVLENDLAPDPKLFRLRIVNLMGGTTEVDVHSGSASGTVIASNVGFGEATNYLSFTPTTLQQNLYVTEVGSTTPLFQTGRYDKPISLPFMAGNSGTIYLMGLPSGKPYSGDAGFFKPYVYYQSDAYINRNNFLQSAQLFIIL